MSLQSLCSRRFIARKEFSMAYVIAEPCIGVKDTACVAVCPVDCIHPTKDETGFAESPMLYIDPARCIDCHLCQDECPVKAIFPEEDLPEQWRSFIEKNAEHYRKRTDVIRCFQFTGAVVMWSRYFHDERIDDGSQSNANQGGCPQGNLAGDSVRIWLPERGGIFGVSLVGLFEGKRGDRFLWPAG